MGGFGEFILDLFDFVIGDPGQLLLDLSGILLINFEDVVTAVWDKESIFEGPGTGTGLYYEAYPAVDRVENDAVVSVEDTLILKYYFNIADAEFDDILANLGASAVIPCPDNLVWEDTVIPYEVFVDTKYGPMKIAEVEIIGGVATITFMGEYWEQGA